MFDVKIWKEDGNIRCKCSGFAVILFPFIWTWILIAAFFVNWHENIDTLLKTDFQKLEHVNDETRIDMPENGLMDNKKVFEHNFVIDNFRWDLSKSIEDSERDDEFLGECGTMVECNLDGTINIIEVWLFDKEDFAETKKGFFYSNPHDVGTNNLLALMRQFSLETPMLRLTAIVKNVDYQGELGIRRATINVVVTRK